VPREVRIRPKLMPRDAEAIARLPEIHYAAIWTQVFQRFEYGGNHTRILGVFGADDRFMEILGRGITNGRSFTAAELRGGEPVAIVEQRTIDRLFGAVNPFGRVVQIGGHPFKVLGVWQRPTISSRFRDPRDRGGGAVRSGTPQLHHRRVEQPHHSRKAKPEVSVNRAMDAATVSLRRLRGLRVGDANTFDLLTSDQVLSIFDSLTFAFFFVMLVLVQHRSDGGRHRRDGDLMVSVTSRTREIGLRKALGATRRAILWQFLIEAATADAPGRDDRIVLVLVWENY